MLYYAAIVNNRYLVIYANESRDSCCDQLIPWIASLTWYTTALPLAGVLSFTAIKDIYDDVVSLDRVVPRCHLVALTFIARQQCTPVFSFRCCRQRRSWNCRSLNYDIVIRAAPLESSSSTRSSNLLNTRVIELH